ncbi:hypothetical protein [Nitrospirillum pindoramense]|uniref:Uncharacterized protein n=1 Tax=Nitrospirillum amazonense TaxID=28077 RepID=A0A560H8K5_9PROT|nr:hypothetical protein [Nitrospirillum amazonense]TWB42665.1 hypothetical protein FBZ90_106266 [Nitrospirillum amazonense]
MAQWTLPSAVADILDQVVLGLRQGRVLPRSVAAAVAALSTLPPHHVLSVREHIRRLLGTVSPPHRQKAWQWWWRPEDMHALLHATPRLEYLFLFHHSGYIREAALRKIEGKVPGPLWLTAVAYQMNDWVAEVRAAARDCMARTVPLMDMATVADTGFFLLTRTLTWGRWRLEPQCDPENLFLMRPEMADALARRICGATHGPAGSVLRQALRQPYMDGHLPFLATNAVQPIVRMVALHTLIEGRAAWPDGWRREMINKPFNIFRSVPLYATRPIVRPASKTYYLEQAARDRSVVVRRLVAATLAQALGREKGAVWEEWRPLLARLKQDPDRSTRESIAFIQRHLAQEGGPLVPFPETLSGGENFDPDRISNRGREVDL